jgi:hypothetical protein
LAKDVKNELEETLAVLSGKGKGTKGKKPRGAERKKMWEDVKALRKECVVICTLSIASHIAETGTDNAKVALSSPY